MSFISVFLPFVLTALAILGIGIYLLISSKRKQIFSFKGRNMFIIFTLYTVAVALAFKNYLGIACSLFFFLIIVISYYARSIMTEQIFEKGLDICCFSAIPVTLCAGIEKLANSADPSYRCKLWFFNENYFCTIMAVVVIACAFKVTAHKSKLHPVWYYICAVFGVVSMYLGESLFAFVELFIGIFVLLLLMKKHGLLAFFILMFASAMILLYLVPDIMPRLSETNITSERRVRIWNEAMEFIKLNPLFGRGFLSYHQLTNGVVGLYQTQHAHNFAIESLISFGIVGSALIIGFLWSYYQKISECKALLRTNTATTFILTVSVAALVHMTTDMTVLWIQTGLLYALILGGVGADEKALNKRILACLNKNNTSSEE